MFIRSLVLSAVAVGSFGLTGCSESSASAPSYGGADGTAIAELVDRVNDDKSNKRRLLELFAAGRKLSPTEHKKLTRFAYEVDGRPAISGDTATATVTFRSESTGDEPPAKEWSFVKEGGEWKVKDAPLP